MSEVPPVADTPQIEGKMFLFRKPELLTKESHGSLGVKRPDRPFAFCEGVRAVPLTISEIALAQKHYPIIFADEKNPMPMAVVGLIDDINLFVDDKGEWEQNCYIPGYIRRYPFALASDQNSDRMAIVVDVEYEGITKKPDAKFFNKDEPSDETKRVMEYCSNYERDRLTTQQFAKTLAEYDLLATQVAQFTPEGSDPQPFAQYIGVEEKRLTDMADEQFIELRKSNILPILYAQLMSMANWRTIMDRRVRRHDLKPDQILKPLTKQ
ncbi:SapC family protein [Parvularcula sp. IMCC14364]|uniref:SapC family protein n=1 Tax=Parvularcula sp. IMCC14364 TaxID=3067902 RepID=UPI0027426D00|nr:SapC family protein [Parvularcula sp. IMCC14364]